VFNNTLFFFFSFISLTSFGNNTVDYSGGRRLDRCDEQVALFPFLPFVGYYNTVVPSLLDDTGAVVECIEGSASSSLMWCLILITSHLLILLLARFFFSDVLYKGQERSRALEAIFCLTCTISASMPLLFVLELFSKGEGQALRLMVWQADKICLLVLNYLILPQLLLWRSIGKFCGATKLVPAGVVLGQLGFWYCSQAIGYSVIKTEAVFSINLLFAHFCVAGTVCVAGLSGFGAVYGPFCNITTFLHPPPSLEHISEMEIRIINTEKLTQQKKVEKKKIQESFEQDPQAFYVSTVAQIFWNTYNYLAMMRQRGHLSRIQSEIQALENLTMEMQLEMDDLVEMREKANIARSLKGQCFNIFGWIMTVCCIVKLFNTLRNIFFPSLSDEVHNPLIRVLVIIFHKVFQWDVDIHSVAPTLTLIFVGYLVFANTRSFVAQVMMTFRMFSHQVSNDTIALLICVVTGMYFAASSLLMRVYLPQRYREELNDTVGFDDRHAYQRLFDQVFFTSAVISGICISGNRYYKNQKFRTF